MKEKIREIIGKAIIRVFPETTGQVFEIAVDYPTREHFGDFTTNVALKSAGLLKRKPLRETP
jgi:arginyl-tRNA synthetase